MIKSIATELHGEIASVFGYTSPALDNGAARDVIWAPDGIALRLREVQVRGLDDDIGALPFISYFRTVPAMLDMSRMNLPVARRGGRYESTGAGKIMHKYKMIPAKFLFQIEHWSRDPETFEDAYRNWLRWSAPASEMTLTDVNSVEFQCQMQFGDGIDNSQLEQKYDKGTIYRATFPLVVKAFVVTADSTDFKTILTEIIDIYDYSGSGSVDGAVLLKELQQT